MRSMNGKYEICCDCGEAIPLEKLKGHKCQEVKN